MREVLAQHHREQLGQRAGDLDAGRATADHHERQRAVVEQAGIAVRRLEPIQHVVPQADRVGEVVQREAVLVDAFDAERVGGRPGGDDEVVERDGALLFEVEAPRVPVDPDDVALAERQVGLMLEDAAHGIGHVGRRETGRGDLVEQRLERVEVVPVDERDVDRRVLQFARRAQPTEPGADDHDTGTDSP